MENTHEFVEKLNETKKKAEKNNKSDNPAAKLPSKQHGTNK